MKRLGLFLARTNRKGQMLCLAASLFFFAAIGEITAQTVTGQIAGNVTDPTGAVVVGAKVALTNTVTGQERDVISDNSGNFVFPELIPGEYQVTITAGGFQTYTQRNISVAASEHVDLHQVQLAIGNVSSEVTVTANQAHVETDSSEHSNLVNSNQMTDVTVKGRNYLSYVALLPGVTSTGQSDAPGWGDTDSLSINGGNSTVLIQLDGISSQDNGINGATAYLAPSADAIQQMKVQTGNMNAEYGSRNGGSINVITKNGTREFHGNLYHYERNNFFNANNYFNKAPHSNLAAVANHPPDYKYHNPGGTIGGPVLIPGVAFNKNRDKLFFFFSADILRRTVPTSLTGPTNLTMPTEQERNGNFSGDVQQGISIFCPGTQSLGNSAKLSAAAAAAFAQTCGVPTSAAGIAMLNLLPKPTCNSANNLQFNENPGYNLPPCVAGATQGNPGTETGYNWQGLLNQPEPRSDYILRVDYNLAKNELWYVRLIKDYQAQNNGTFLGGSGWPGQLLTSYQIHSSGAVSTLVSTIRPNLINEFTAGVNRALQTTSPWNSANFNNNIRTNVGLGPNALPVLFPDASSPFNAGGFQGQSPFANANNLIPNAFFQSTGLSEPGNSSAELFNIEGRWPFFGTDTEYNITDNLTWVKSNHTFKVGVYWEKTSRNGPSGGSGAIGTSPFISQFNGVLNFNQSATNPVDTGFSFSNAYLGAFQSYTEFSAHPLGYDRWHSIEWFAQDTWKITRRLTLDYGIRFQYLVPTYDKVETSAFRTDVYSRAAQPALIQPCLVGGARGGCYESSSGTVIQSGYPVGAIGSFVPQATSSIAPFQGMVAYSPYQGVVSTPPTGIGPRFGFAYDVFGNGKTALRGGYGMFYNLFGTVDTVGQLVLQPPPPGTSVQIPPSSRQELVVAPFVYNTTIPQILSAETSGKSPQVFLGPQNVIGLPRNFKSPALYAFNLDVQQDLGHGLLLDVAYVGNLARHNGGSVNFDLVPYGADFQCTGGGFANSSGVCASGSLRYADPTSPGHLLSTAFQVPNPGYSTISQMYENLNSNYNSLQAQVSKRFGKSLTMNASWTWAKILGYTQGNPFTEMERIVPNLNISGIAVPARVYYGLQSGYRKHTINVNWAYNLPKTHFERGFLKQALNGWVYEGTFTYLTGAPGTVTLASGLDLTGANGSGTLTRPNLVPNEPLYLPKTAKSNDVQFLNLSAFAPPTGGPGQCVGTYNTCGVGNSGPVNFIGPVTNQFNMSIFKNFMFGQNEAPYLQFRFETYNTFNHTQFTTAAAASGAFATTAINLCTAAGPGCSAANAINLGSSNTNTTTFGTFNGSQPARIIALALKLFF